ncbi:MAG: serine/threonine protein kinase [Myxococcales bacterium]|nr:serine/threonine protein kinase [Myxococcales bacterium]
MEKPEVTRGAVERTFGRYQLIEPIAKGGMAEVWRAKLIGAERFERPMVIKRILPHLCEDPEFVQMFVAEARLSARLHHPNIVQVFELGDVDGELFMAIEQVVGVELLTLMRTLRAPLPAGLCALVAHDLCRALAYAYGVSDERGAPLAIVHRDVSPSNVMLSYDGHVRLLDFGIAKALGRADHRSRTGRLKGKVSYMAPEVLDGAPFDHRADLFAVGVVLFEMLTGRRLFHAGEELQLMAEVRACRVPLPSSVNPDVLPGLERVALRALAREPAQRYQHANEMLAELAPLLHDLRWSAEETAAFLQQSVPPGSELSEEMPATASASPLPRRASRTAAPTTVTPMPLRVARERARTQRRWRAAAVLGAVALVLISALVTMRALRHSRPAGATVPAIAAPQVATPIPAPPVATPSPTVATPSPPVATPPSRDEARTVTRPARRTAPPRHTDQKRRQRQPFNLERGDVLDSLQ